MIPLSKPTEQILAIGALVVLVVGCFLVLQPFLSALLWAAILCFSTWPIYARVETALGGRRAIAALAMTLLVAVVLIAPLAVVVATLADNVGRLVVAAARILEQGPPAPPPWVSKLPGIGEGIATYWERFANDAPAFTQELARLIGPATGLAVGGGALLGNGLLELGLSVFIAFFFYRHGRVMAGHVRAVTERFAGARGRSLVTVVGATVQGVVYGFLGTALVQAILAGIGFWIAGVPGALFLGFVTLILSVLPFGPPLVWGGVALWFLAQGSIGWAVFVALWGLLLVSSIDNVIKPYLIGQTSNLPMLLGLFGVIGGVLAFGFIGVFLGPALLAVGHSLFLEWSLAEAEERLRPSPPRA